MVGSPKGLTKLNEAFQSAIKTGTYTAANAAMDVGIMGGGTALGAISAKQAASALTAEGMEVSARVAAETGARWAAKTGSKALGSVAKAGKAAAGPVGIATLLVTAGAFVSDSEHNLLYAAMGRDFREERNKMMMDDSTIKNPISGALSGLSGGVRDIGDGINSTIGASLKSVWDSMPKGEWMMQQNQVIDPETGEVTYEPVEVYQPGFGELMNGAGDVVNNVVDALIPGTVDDVQTMTNNFGMDIGLAPVELTGALRQDEAARAHVEEMLSEPGFGEEGLFEQLCAVYDKDRGNVVGGWAELDAIMSAQKEMVDEINSLDEEGLRDYVRHHNWGIVEDNIDGVAQELKDMAAQQPQFSAASLGIVDPAQYLDGMTVEKANNMIVAASAVGLVSDSPETDDGALVKSDIVDEMITSMKAGELSQEEVGAFFACQLDRAGMLGESGELIPELAMELGLSSEEKQDMDVSVANTMAANDMPNVSSAKGASVQKNTGRYEWQSDREVIQFMQNAIDLGIVDASVKDEAVRLVESGDATWTDIGDELMAYVDEASDVSLALDDAEKGYSWSSDAEVIEFIQEAEALGIVDSNFSEAAASYVADGGTYAEVGDALLLEVSQQARQNQGLSQSEDMSYGMPY